MKVGILTVLVFAAILLVFVEAGRKTGFGRRNKAIRKQQPPSPVVTFEKTCLSQAPKSATFAVILDVTNSTKIGKGKKRDRQLLTYAKFINGIRQDINPESFYVGILDQSKIYYFKDDSKNTERTAVSFRKRENKNKRKKKANNGKKKSRRQRGNLKFIGTILSALINRTNGLDMPEAVKPPDTPFIFTIVITDGSQHTSPTEYPEGPRLIVDVNGQWTVNTAINYLNRDVIVLEGKKPRKQLRSLLATIRYAMCQQVGGNKGKTEGTIIA